MPKKNDFTDGERDPVRLDRALAQLTCEHSRPTRVRELPFFAKADQDVEETCYGNENCEWDGEDRLCTRPKLLGVASQARRGQCESSVSAESASQLSSGYPLRLVSRRDCLTETWADSRVNDGGSTVTMRRRRWWHSRGQLGKLLKERFRKVISFYVGEKRPRDKSTQDPCGAVWPSRLGTRRSACSASEIRGSGAMRLQMN